MGENVCVDASLERSVDRSRLAILDKRRLIAAIVVLLLDVEPHIGQDKC